MNFEWKNFFTGLAIKIGSIIAGSMGYAVKSVISMVTSGYGALKKYNQEGVALARQMGINAHEAQAYTTTMITRAEKLCKVYGIAAEQVMELQKNITNATSKQYMLNDAEAETMVQINKIVGSNIFDQFTTEMMNGMGAQLNTVQGAVSKAYATAAKSGLNAQKMSEKIASNLSMANRLSFRNGINGLTRMAMQAEKVGMNLQSVESAAMKFMDLEQAIQNSAQMQMLGGSAAAMFGNPLTAMYEANYDPESFAKRMQDSLASYATFDAKSGISNINGMNMDFVRQIASALGIGVDEASKMAKKQSEVRYKKGAFGAALGNYSQEQQDFILNKSFVKDGRLKINDINGQEHDISNGMLPKKILDEMMKFNGKSDRDIMESQALTLTSIDEQIKGFKDSFDATLANALNRYVPDLKKVIDYIGKIATSKVAPAIANGIITIGDYLKAHGPAIKNAADLIVKWAGNIYHFLVDYWHWIAPIGGAVLAYIGLRKATQFVYGVADMGKNFKWNPFARPTGGPAMAANAAKGGLGSNLLKAGRFLVSGSWNIIKAVGRFQLAWMKGTWNLLKGGFNLGKSLITKGGELATKGWNAAKRGGTRLMDAQSKFVSEVKPKQTFKQIKANAIRSYKNTLNRGGSKTRALKNATKNIIKNVKSPTAFKAIGKSLLRGGVGGIVAGAAGMGLDYLTDSLTEKGKINKGSGAHQALKATSKALEYGGTGAMIGSVFGPLGTAIGAGVGGLVGAVKGAYDSWKSLPENADKGILDYAAYVGSSIIDSGKSLIKKVGGAFSAFNNNIQERGGYLSVAFKYITMPIRLFIDTLKGIATLIANPVDTIKSIWNKLTSWLSGDRVLGKLLDKAVDYTFGAKKENHADGGIVGGNSTSGDRVLGKLWGNAVDYTLGTKKEKHADGGIVGGNSTSGDKIVTGLNSGEMVLNANQQTALFNFISSILPSMLKSSSNVSGNRAYSNVHINNVYSNVSSYRATNPEAMNILSNDNGVRTKPVGEKQYIYIPNKTETSNVNGNTVTVKDFNVNISGTIKLDGGNNSKNVDINELLNDRQFVNKLKDMIKDSINVDIHGGRYGNSWELERGYLPH